MICTSVYDPVLRYLFMFAPIYLTDNSFLYSQLIYMVPNTAACLQRRTCWMLNTLTHQHV